jgi:hypothetical protein
MNVFLLYRDRDFEPEAELPRSADLLTQDLGLEILFAAMAAGDRFLLQVATTAVLTGLDDVDAIRYRQDILADCLDRPAVVRELYALAVEALERARRNWWYSPRFPDSVLHRSVDLIGVFVGILKRMRGIAEVERAGVRSEGFGRLFDEIAAELDDRYLQTVEDHLDRLRFPGGVVLSAELGTANRGTNYVLRRRVSKATWRERIGLPEPGTYVYQLPERDEAGAQALGELRGRGIALAADALGQSTDHMLSYFTQLRAELGFYVGCLNLRELLDRKCEPT